MSITEENVIGKKYRIWDSTNSIWKRLSFWTKASDVECDDGSTVETKIGGIKGITTDLTTTETGYAADMTSLGTLATQINDNLNVRYNASTDTIEALYEDTWQYIMNANLQTHYLYNAGNEYTSITGGYALTNNTSYNGKVQKLSGAINAYGNTNGAWGSNFAYSSKKVDITNYSKLKVTLSEAAIPNIIVTYGLCANIPTAGAKQPTMDTAQKTLSNGVLEYELDISAFSGNYYVCVGCLADIGYTNHAYIKTIWLYN